MVIMYANRPILWRSTLQTEIALSTVEAEYISLSTALRQVIPLMTMMEEIHAVFPIHISKPDFVCKVHEDNQLCIKMATGIKFSPSSHLYARLIVIMDFAEKVWLQNVYWKYCVYLFHYCHQGYYLSQSCG